MKKRLLSLVLCLVMVFSLFPFVASAEYAAPVETNDSVITNPVTAQDGSKNLNLTKTLTEGANGTYDLKLESWATGEVKAYTEKIPTDFVVVVDQSGSMDTPDMPTGTPQVRNNVNLETVADGAYYYKAADGNYYRVYGVKDYLFRYYPANTWYVGDILDRVGADRNWFQGETEQSFNYDNQFYWKEGNAYRPIKLTIAGKTLTYYNKFSYVNGAGETITFDRDNEQYGKIVYKNLLGEFGWGPTIDPGEAGYSFIDGFVRGVYKDKFAYTFSEVKGDSFLTSWININTGMLVNYPMYDRNVGYTKLCYRDVNGDEYEVPSNQNGGQSSWEYCQVVDNQVQAITTYDGSTRPTYSGLYTFKTATDRITALKAALTEFADAVSKETDSFGAVDNRVSIVGFASTSRSVVHDPSGSPNYSNYNYNTELLTHTEYNISSGSTNGWQKNTCDGSVSEYYGKALVGATNGTVGTVNPKIERAIDAITANGGTQPEDGLNMAYQILTNRGTGEGKDTYKIRSGAQKDQLVDRNTIVIFFTDGQPGNLDMSNQYLEANEVVAQASAIKDYKDTTIFSIGVFGESDANPLTYDARNDWTKNNSGQDVQVKDIDTNLWSYLGGWMETHYANGTNFCLRRQWRPSNADYTEQPNDTIFDYMSVVSSNYKTAENFIDPAWLAGNFVGTDPNVGDYVEATEGVRHASVNGNQYYRMASSQDTLVAAFLAAVTMNNQETGTPVTINSTAVLQDQLNLTDFDVSGASLDAKVIDVGTNAKDTTLSGQLDTSASDLANGVVKVSGFDYAQNYVVNNQGKKLVVTITGLTPKAFNQDLYSNVDTEDVLGAGIYGQNAERPTVQIESPIVNVKKLNSYYVADFNAPLIVAKDATINSKNVTNGDFKMSGEDAVYQLNYASGTIASSAVTLNSAYTTADTASIKGKHVSDGKNPVETTQTVSVIPAGSVYYDDDLASGNAIPVGDGSGYNENVSASPASTNTAKGQYTFTFYGTGIDIYCTTDNDGGYVQAKLTTKAGAAVPGQPNQSVRNYTNETARYNVPSISYTGLPAGEYTVTLNVLGSSNYKLDGIRVYNPVSNETYDGQGAEAMQEQYAAYINMREALVNDKDVSTAFTDDMTEAVLGALFVDDSSKLTMEPRQQYDAQTHEPRVDAEGNPIMGPAYASVYEAYQKNSPKHEIYLSKNQAIVFQLTEAAETAAANGNLWIGLSAPDAGKNSGTLTLKEGKTIDVTSGVDMYYPITSDMIGADRVVTLTNTGDNMISVTNLKITGNKDIYNAAYVVPTPTPVAGENGTTASVASVLSVEDAISMVFEPMTMRSVKIAANNGVDPDEVVPETPAPTTEPEVTPEPTPDPTPAPVETPAPVVTPAPTQAPSIHNIVKQIVSSFVNNLFRSISRLFGN